MAASPDGALLAIAVYNVPGPTPTPLPPNVSGGSLQREDYIVIYDIEQRREVIRFESTSPELADFDGRPGGLQWRGDGQGVYLWGATHSERPGGSATLFLDGRIVQHDLSGYEYVAPNSQLAADGINSIDCMFISGHDVVLRDLDTGGVLTEQHDEARAFTGFDWSPDSREFLVESRPYDESLRCEDDWTRVEPDLLLLNTVTGLVEEVTDLEALSRRWYGEDLIWLDCGGQFVPPRPHPFGNGKTLRCDQPGTLHLQGQTVSVGEIVSPLGIIE